MRPAATQRVTRYAVCTVTASAASAVAARSSLSFWTARRAAYPTNAAAYVATATMRSHQPKSSKPWIDSTRDLREPAIVPRSRPGGAPRCRTPPAERSQRLEELHQVGLLRARQAQAERRVVVVDHGIQRREATVVVEAALLAGEQTPQRGRPVVPVGRPVGLESVDPDLRAGVHVPAGLGVERRNVALGAVGLAGEQLLPARRRVLVEAVLRRPRSLEAELVSVQRSQLGGDQVRVGFHMPEPLAGSYGEFVRVVEARVVEVSLPVHLENRDEGIPIGNASPARVGVQVHAGQAERGGNERRGGLAVGPERF